MKTKSVFLNGQFLPADKASVSIFDRGFLYGDGLLETFRSYKGNLFAFDGHLERLIEGTKILGIPFKIKKSYLLNCIDKLLQLNNLMDKDAYIRLTITRGRDYGGLIPNKPLKPTITIIARPLDNKIKRYQQKGITAIFLDSKRNLPHIKSLNLLTSVLGLTEAIHRNTQEGIFTDRNKVLEGTITNIFISDGNKIKTPPIRDGILPGITRRLVIELAKKEGIKVSESSIIKNELINSNEAFLTNSIMEIIPLLKVENNLIGNGNVGILTLKLKQGYKRIKYNKKIHTNFMEQITNLLPHKH